MPNICKQCGESNNDNATICSKCGCHLVESTSEKKVDSLNNDNQESTANRKKDSKRDKELKEKYREKMHGDGGEQFNSFVSEGKKKHSSKIIRIFVSVMIVAILAITGKIVYDNIKNRNFIIRNVSMGMTKEEVKKAEEGSGELSEYEECLEYKGIEYAKIKGDIFYNFSDNCLIQIAIKFDYNEESLKKIRKELQSKYGLESDTNKDKTRCVFKNVKDDYNVYLVVSKENNVIEIDVCEPNDTLDAEIKDKK